jgi:hypothetical protein
VQVKGKNVQEKEIENTTYPVKIDDIKNYLKDGGVSFFVVYLSPKLKYRIYKNGFLMN